MLVFVRRILRSNDQLSSLLFLVLGGVAVLSALAVVILKNPIYSVLSLIVCFFCVAGNYLLLHAEFLAIVNVIVYAGAIMVLFLFVIMLLNLNSEKETRKPIVFQGIAILAGGLILASVLLALNPHPVATGPVVEGSLKALSKVLFGEYMLPFELSSVLFLTAIVGVVLISRRHPDEGGSQ